MSDTNLAASVVIPARNVARWVPRALASIGPEPCLEILVVDDGSTDSTPALLRAASQHDPRIRILAGPSQGPSAARNLALAAARAPLIAFLDADDRWRPSKLARQLALHAARPDLGFSFTDYRHLSMDGQDFGTCFGFWPRFAARHAGRRVGFELGPDAMAQIYAENVVGTSTVVASTALLRSVGGFGEVLCSAEDWDLWLKLAAEAPVGCVPEVLADYSIGRPGAVSRDRNARLTALREIARRHAEPVRRMAPSAISACEARLLVAQAEAAETEGRRHRGAALRIGALVRQPNRRLAREAAAGLWRAVKGNAGGASAAMKPARA